MRLSPQPSHDFLELVGPLLHAVGYDSPPLPSTSLRDRAVKTSAPYDFKSYEEHSNSSWLQALQGWYLQLLA